MKITGKVFGPFVFAAFFCFSAGSVFAQGGDTGGGGDLGGGQIPNVGGGQIPATGGDTGGLGGNTAGADVGLADLLGGITVPEVEIENLRRQPYVGRSIERYELQNAGAHPRSNAATPGAGVTTGGGGGGFAFPGLQGRGQGAGQGLGQGATNSVVRRSLRTRLVPRFQLSSPVSTSQVSSRFQRRLTRIPATDSVVSGVQIRVEGKTAFLTGVVASPAERDRLERMARLEPGIYKIENTIRVGQ